MTTAATANPASRYRWFILSLVFLATTVNYIDRQILALLNADPGFSRDIGWNKFQFGLVNSAFQAAYALGLLWFGSYVDRAGEKKGYSLSILGWSIAAILHAPIIFLAGMKWKMPQGLEWLAENKAIPLVSAGFFAFVVARVLLGLFEGGNFPAAIKTVTHWFPRRERALATSLFNAGSNAGAIFAPALVPLVIVGMGWEWTFILAGIAGLLWLALWLPKYGQPDERPEISTAELALIRSEPQEAPGKPLSWKSALGHRQAWSFIICKFLTDPVWWFFLVWLPTYFKDARGLDLKNSWGHLVSIYAIITVLSIAGGWLTGHLIKSGWSVTRARKTGMLVFALLVVPILMVRDVNDWAVVGLIGLAGAAHQAWSATIFTTVSDMFPKRAVATIVGIGGTAGAIGGMLFTPLAGILLDRLGNSAYSILFGICGSAYLVAFAASHLLAPTFEPVKLKD